jgi:hypothetical protein
MLDFLRLLWVAVVALFLCANGETAAPQPEQNGDKEKQPKQGDAAAIAQLVAKLGSTDFTERQEATKALEAIGFRALDALRKAAKGADAEAARRATRLVAIIENSMAQLLADYRAYGLPLPPTDAKLVRFESGGRYILNGKLMPPTYFLGYLLAPGAKDKPAVLLVGTQELRLEPRMSVEVVESKLELFKSIDLGYWEHATFESNAGLAVAVKCKERGWHALAQKIWTASNKRDSGHHFGAFYRPANLDNRTAVAYLAWVYSGNELVKPNSDRIKTAKRMKSLLAAEPRLDTVGNRALLKSLEAALVPSSAKPGTVPKLIDDLTEMCNTGPQDGKPDPHYAPLAQMGFEAVPTLIEHLDDERLTRSIKQGFNNSPTWNLRVADVVSDLLQELAGEEVGQDWLRRQQGYAVERKDAQAWWEKASKEGEESYFLAHVLPKDEKSQWPNSLMLSIISEKYPKHLPDLYKTVLDSRHKIQSWPVAAAVAKSSLPMDRQRELFLFAARHKNLAHRRLGLSYLQKLDPQQFITILLETLDALPKTPTEPYWACPEAAFTHLVKATDDPRAWSMLEKVAIRSDVGLRMEFMNPMDYSNVREQQRQQRLKFLAAFLDDVEAPDVSKIPEMYSGPHAGFTFRRLAVRDLAAMKIASILEMSDEPDRDWTPQQWEALRKKLKQALKK